MSEREDQVNWDAALDALGGDEDLLKELVQVFLDEGPALVARMRQAIAKEEGPELRRAAHTLQGSLRYFESEVTIALARDLEKLAEAKSFTDAPALLQELEGQLAGVLRVLRQRAGIS